MINQSYEPAAKLLAATGLSQSLSFCMERKYLQNICGENANGVFQVEVVPSTAKEEASWIEITQVGKPVDKTSEECFTAIQKILYSAFLPKQTQLLFLINGDGTTNRMYLGVRALTDQIQSKTIIRSLNEFVRGTWPGLQTKVVKESDSGLSTLKKDIASEKFSYVNAFTGIPSMESQYKSVYPATTDKLIAGLNKSKRYVYFVVADPIEPNETEAMIYECREMNGQAESLKTMNVTQGLSHSVSESLSRTLSSSDTVSHSTSVTKRDFSKLGKAALAATGLGVAASFFPAAEAILDGAANVTGELAAGVAGLLGGSMIGNAITGAMPTKTESESFSHTDSHSETRQTGSSDTNSQSISRNVINKHVEAVAEKLFYQSHRLENGEATGLWKVGVYLLADKKSDIVGGSMQLRSILSGNESVYEPIRVHDISDKVDDVLKDTLARLSSPKLVITSPNGKPFEHPLGSNYKELKTVLTTKELSYLINFPLRSVPGISVVDSCPEFSLNEQPISESDSMPFGSILYGGSPTSMSFRIPVNQLSRHTLISGINGTGKTNTVQAILNGLGKTPFLVIEPAKTEYVDWAIEYNKSHRDNPINIYIPSCKKYKGSFEPAPLYLNPFQMVWLDRHQEPNVLAHIDRLKSTFASAFPMYDILPVLMEDLIYTVYQNKTTNWLTEDPQFGVTRYPTLTGMSISVNKVLENRGYEQRVEQNMKACLNTRIDSLKRGWKGEILNTTKTTDWKKLFERPTVINLSYVGDDVDKGFFMSLVLQFLYEYRQALAELGLIDFNDNSCRHLTVIEEAHRVMSKCEDFELPQYKSAMMFSNMLSEIRAYGEGMMLVDQVPTRLIPDAIKNTSLKITHRLVAEDDQKAIAESMGLNEEQRKIIPKLLTGQCIVSSSLSTDIHWIKVNKVK